MNREEYNTHVIRLADAACRLRHRDKYNELICYGPNESNLGPPCNDCRRRIEDELNLKRQTAHGVDLSEEEADTLRKRLGLS